jgi:cell division protein ZapA (FtsZ GTPase activity inhibitor)
MKQKYTIRIADVEMNVITEESPEAVEALVSIVDRKMREIEGASKRCTKSEAALLCALDYCSERIKAQRRIKTLESKLAMAETTVEELEMENEELRAKVSADGRLV